MVRGSPNPRNFCLPARLRKARKQSGLTRKGVVQMVGGDQDKTAIAHGGYSCASGFSTARHRCLAELRSG